MDIDRKRELKGTISLLDQAIAPLTLALGKYKEVSEEEMQNFDEKDTARRDLAHKFDGASKAIGDMVAELNDMKLWIEKL